MADDFVGRLTTWHAIEEFLWAGRAHFTLLSLKNNGMRYTYRVDAKKEDVAAKLADVTYFLKLLRGPDNAADYLYMGVLRKPGRFFVTSASKVTRRAPSVTALLWFLDKMERKRDVLGSQVDFWHTGRCGRCGRLLTVLSSVALGLGPVCDGRSEAV